MKSVSTNHVAVVPMVVWVLVALVAVQAVQELQELPEEVRAQWQHTRRQRMVRALKPLAAPTDQDQVDCNTAKTMYACASSCIETITCSQSGDTWKAIRKESCPSKTPYCLDGDCTATVPADLDTCRQAASSPPATTAYTCNGDGYFPDVTDCHKYYFCAAGKAYAMDCGRYPDTVYHHLSNMCVHKSKATCYRISCTEANKSTLQAYTPAPSVYAICGENLKADSPQAYKCREGQVLDVKTNPKRPVCAAGCLQAGRVPDPSKANSYLECVDLGGGKLSMPVPFTCPEGSTFVEDKQRCEVDTTSAATTPNP